jgi:hypothetical protein
MENYKMKYQKLLFVILIASVINLFAQTGSINNTLGTGGSFIVKDGANNFLRVDQLTGNTIFLKNMELGSDSTSSLTSGVITKGSKRFLHNYAPNGSEFNNLFIGLDAGNFTMGGGTISYESSYNIGIGSNSLSALTTGFSNTAVGSKSLLLNTTGNDNTAIGYCPLYSNTTGMFNTAVGNYALFYNNGQYNSAFGHNSLVLNTQGNFNTAIGCESLHSNKGDANTAIGFYSQYLNQTGTENTSVGKNSLSGNISGYMNTAIGVYAGSTITTGYNLTLLGNRSQPSLGSASNEITLGNNFVTTLRCNVQTITSLSDARDKKNIKDLSIGLDFLMKVKPREFNWDRREWYENGISDGSKIQDHPTAGFIAQEFDSLQTTEHADWLNLVLKNNPDKWEATYGNLLPVIVKAVQELKNENDQLKSEVESLKSVKEQLAEIESLKEELADQIKMLKANNESTNVKFSSIED